jgi:hypothetical protein
MTNPFATEEAWEVSTGEWIPVGDHATKVDSIDGTGTSSGNFPQIEVIVKDGENRTRKDWINISANTVGKVVQFLKACGVEPPPDEAVDANTYRIDDAWLKANVLGKPVGVIVRERPGRSDPTKNFPEIVGYVPVSQVASSDMTGPGGQPVQTAMAGAGGAKPPQNAIDDSIPF